MLHISLSLGACVIALACAGVAVYVLNAVVKVLS